MEDLGNLFKELDENFIGLDKTSDETYMYNATDVLVQTTWELPIVIQCPESVVNFEFCSNPGDISFGIVFVAAPEEGQDLNDLDIETVEEMGIVRSNLDSISGSFEVPYEGVVFFMWDNNFDWSANKQISYMIEVKQPSFTYADKLRVENCVPLLRETEEELQTCYARCADAQDLIEHNTANEAFMEEQLESLVQKLETKQKEKASLDAEIDQCRNTILTGNAAKAGLCIRMLDKHLLSVVIGYLDLNGGVNYVCKYWASLAEANRSNPDGPISGASQLERVTPSKKEISTALSQIYAAARLREMSALAQLKQQEEQDATRASASANSSVVSAQTSATAATATMIVGTPAAVASISVRSGKSSYTNGASGVQQQQQQGEDSARIGSRTASATAGDMMLSDSGEGEGDAAGAGVGADLSDVDIVGVKGGGAGAGSSGRGIGAIARKSNSSNQSLSVRVSYDNMLPSNHTVAIGTDGKRSTKGTKKGESVLLSAGSDRTGVKNNIDTFTKSVSHPLSPLLADNARKSLQSNAATAGDNGTAAVGSGAPTATMADDIGFNVSRDQKQNSNIQSSTAKDTAEPSSTTAAAAEVSLPMVAESKRRSRPAKASRSQSAPQQQQQQQQQLAGSSGKGRSSSGKRNAPTDRDRSLLQHVQKVRSEQQLNAMIEYLQGGFVKIESISNEKRRIKKLIRAWNNSFEKKHGRYPTSSERKGHLRELYEEYHQVSLALRIRKERMDETLKSVGLTKESFDQLCEKQKIDW